MKAFSYTLLGVLLATGSLSGASWHPLENTEFVRRSESIVVARVVEQNVESWTLKVDKVIKGPDLKELKMLPVHPFKSALPENIEAPLIWGLRKHEDRFAQVHPDGTRAVDQEPQLRKALDQFARPTKYLDEQSPGMAFVVGDLFQDPAAAEANGLTREEGAKYLIGCLHTDDELTTMYALDSLAKMKEASAVSAVGGLLEKMAESESYAFGSRNAFIYLKTIASPEAVALLERTLMDSMDDYPRQHWLADPSAQALGALRAESSLALIHEAAKFGVQRAEEALVYLGTTETFEMLLTAYLDDEEPGSQPNTLHWLVRRSNREFESWMYTATYNTNIGVDLKPKWKTWWEENGNGFEVVRPAEEAIKELQEERESKTSSNQK